MRSRIIAAAAVVAAMLAVMSAGALSTARAAADPHQPPFIERVQWVQWDGKPSLRVYPSVSGRAAAGDIGTGAEGDAAWREVLALAPDADNPGMREQFACHWQFAEFAHPGKTSWNLEPWRPVVDDATMFATGCNPGGAEEPF